jgi:hypothetical protein
LVRLEKETSAEGIDFALSPVLLYDRNMEPGMKNDENANTLAGKVMDANGKAIEGAVVYLMNEQGQPLAFVQTGSDGSYEFNGVQAGYYYVQASKPGYATQVNGAAVELSQAVPLVVLAGRNEVHFALRAGQPTGVRRPPGKAPSGIVLLGCYPNPFNQGTRVAFELAERTRVTVRIFNARGQEIAVPCDRVLDAGFHAIDWIGNGRNGRPLPSGLYVFQVRTAKIVRTGKAVLLR